MAKPPLYQSLATHAMAACMAVMALAVFLNVVLRYGFGSGVAASEELSRLLFVWMVFIGTTAAFARGEHMAFTALLRPWRHSGFMPWVARLIHLLVLVACVFVGWGAWQQVVVGLGSHSVVMKYPTALLPLPAFLCSMAIGVMALIDLWRGRLPDFGHESEVE